MVSANVNDVTHVNICGCVGWMEKIILNVKRDAGEVLFIYKFEK